METRTYTVYTYAELPKKSQELAIDKWKETDEYDFLQEDMEYKLDELLKKTKIILQYDSVNIYYSLSCCQGDGAMFEMLGEWKYYGKTYDIKVKHSGMYNHFNSKEIDITDEDGEWASVKVCERFNNLYVDICQELARYGYDCIDAHNEEANIIDIFEANEYMFNIFGDIDRA